MATLKKIQLIMKHFNFIPVIFVFLTFFSCRKSISESANKNIENEITELSENNFYDFIKQFEYLDYNKNGTIKEYNYVSPKSGDTLLRIYYNQNGLPDSIDNEKRSVYIASENFNNGNTIKYSINPPKFYNRIRVYYDIDDEQSIIDTISNTIKYNVYELPRADILFTMVDSQSNRVLYDSYGFVKIDFDSTKVNGSIFFFE